MDIELFSIYDIFTWNGLRPTDADQTLRVLFLEPSRAKLINLTSEQAVMELSNLTRDEKGQILNLLGIMLGRTKLNSLLITQKNKYKQLQRKRSSKQCVSKTFFAFSKYN